MHWFEEHYIFKKGNKLKAIYWKRELDDIFILWRHGKDELENSVWRLNGIERRIQFTLKHEENNVIALSRTYFGFQIIRKT